MSGLAYYPGCSLHGTGREYGESIQAVAGALGIEMREIKDWACCGASPAHAIDPAAAHALGLWNLARASDDGAQALVTGCAACFSRLRAAREELLDHPETAEEIRAIGGRVPNTQLEVLHIAQVLGKPDMREKIKAAVKKPLGGAPVACYYGCLLTRPRGKDPLDDAEDPHLLEDLVRLAGAEPVDFPLRLDCCGSSLTLARPGVVHDLSGRLIAMAHDRGAKAIVVACPLCHANLDFQQQGAAKAKGFNFRMPVVYLTQLLGLAMGLSEKALGLQRHFVPVGAGTFAGKA